MRKFDTKTRVLLLYMLLLNNIPLSKQELELLFDVDYRTIDRDISAIRNALAESKTIGYSLEQYYLDYDRNQKKICSRQRTIEWWVYFWSRLWGGRLWIN